MNDPNVCNKSDSNNSSELNKPIIPEEIVTAIKEMPNGKAPGADSILAEMLKNTVSFIIPIFQKFRILDSGVYNYSKRTFQWPQKLQRNLNVFRFKQSIHAIIVSTSQHVGGVKWILNEEQAGFGKSRSNRDGIFVFQCITQKYLSKRGGRCYSP